MTIKELIDELSKVPDKRQTVLMSKDGEGNGFKKLSPHFDEMLFTESEEWHDIELWDKQPDSDDFKAPDAAKPCLVLWPE